MGELGALVLSLGTLVLPQSPSSQATDAVSSPVTGVERPGQGVSSPILLHETKPNYTAAAMRARIQGVVVMECVVEVDGSVGAVRVTRSLDTAYGLDDEAVRNLKQWRFRPGMRDGTPVRVAVSIEMSFTLRDRREALVANAAAPLGWPDAFSDASAVSDTLLRAGWRNRRRPCSSPSASPVLLTG
jgi:TonB family protein